MASDGRDSIAVKKCAISKKAQKIADRSKWLKAVKNHVTETETGILNMASTYLGVREFQSLFKFLPDSKVAELELDSRNLLISGMNVLVPLLTETKIKKVGQLMFSGCTKRDLLLILEALQDSQITDLSIWLVWDSDFFDLCELDYDDACKCILYLQKSKVIVLESNLFSHFPPAGLASLIQDYLSTPITHLNLASCKLNLNAFTSLFTNLGHSSVTDLNLNFTGITPEALEELSQRLVKTKIEKLNLSGNELENEQLNILVKGLVGSKVTDLNLGYNRLSNLSLLFFKLRETRIETLSLALNPCLRYEKFIYANSLRCSSLTSLDLSWCNLSDEAGEALMEGIRFSNMKKLNVSWNSIGSLFVKKFAENVQNINLTDLDVSFNPFPLDAFFNLGKCLRESKLTRIIMHHIKSDPPLEADHLFSFLQLTEGSSIVHIDMGCYHSIWSRPPLSEPKMLVNTTLTELNFWSSYLGNNVLNLVPLLKYTAVSHLNLRCTKISDDGATALAEILKETQIRRLYLDNNSITSQGAKALALSLKDTNLLCLHLNSNKIENDGLEVLAENATDTFMSELDVSNNPGQRFLLVDAVLWQNKISVHRLVSVFKQIAPRCNNEFCFDQNIADSNVTACLEKYMVFYKTVTDKPQAISVLLEEKIVSLSREQMAKLLYEDFPLQFSRFVACRIDADVTEHVAILEKAEGMGLTAIVESLLLNRPVYVLDEEQCILHPHVYKLLLKYKQPVCNLLVEPRGVVKIIEYFTEHVDIEGAQDLINLLNNAKIC